MGTVFTSFDAFVSFYMSLMISWMVHSAGFDAIAIISSLQVFLGLLLNFDTRILKGPREKCSYRYMRRRFLFSDLFLGLNGRDNLQPLNGRTCLLDLLSVLCKQYHAGVATDDEMLFESHSICLSDFSMMSPRRCAT